MADLVKTLLPWKDPEDFLGGLPAGIDARYYAGGERPALDGIEFYVPSYMGSSEVVEVIAEMPALKVVQTQTAGFENVLPHLRPLVRAHAEGKGKGKGRGEGGPPASRPASGARAA